MLVNNIEFNILTKNGNFNNTIPKPISRYINVTTE